MSIWALSVSRYLYCLQAATEKRIRTGGTLAAGTRSVAMFQFLQILALLLVALAMAFAVAHAAELPGKMRLDRDSYMTIQTVYSPGFTIGGFSEPVSIIIL